LFFDRSVVPISLILVPKFVVISGQDLHPKELKYRHLLSKRRSPNRASKRNSLYLDAAETKGAPEGAPCVLPNGAAQVSRLEKRTVVARAR
jgi:hypothetical protein